MQPYLFISTVLLHYFVYIHSGVVDHQINNVTSKLDKMQHLSTKCRTKQNTAHKQAYSLEKRTLIMIK